MNRYRMRTLLMMLGILVGISSLAVLTAVGEGTRRETMQRFKNMVGTYRQAGRWTLSRHADARERAADFEIRRRERNRERIAGSQNGRRSPERVRYRC